MIVRVCYLLNYNNKMIYSLTFHLDATCLSLTSSLLIVCDTIGLAGNSPTLTGVMESCGWKREEKELRQFIYLRSVGVNTTTSTYRLLMNTWQFLTFTWLHLTDWQQPRSISVTTSWTSTQELKLVKEVWSCDGVVLLMIDCAFRLTAQGFYTFVEKANQAYDTQTWEKESSYWLSLTLPRWPANWPLFS